MSDWTERNWPVSTEVEVEVFATGKICLGWLATPYIVNSLVMPKIRLASGPLISGFDAHWIPTLREINAVRVQERAA